jgi:hypothetical protein
MAVPGRIFAGRTGPAERPPLPDATGFNLALRSPKDN